MPPTKRDASRPWIASYPDGVAWDGAIDTTPVHEQVLAACARTPRATALDFLGGTTSFGALAEAIAAFAGALQKQLGVTRGARVALMLPNTPFYLIAYYGVLRAGGTVVNCNPLYTIAELSHITGDSGADIMVTLDLKQMFDKGEALLEAGHVRQLIVCHFPDALPLLKKVLFRFARGKDLARPRQSPHAGAILDFGALLARKDRPDPVRIAPQKDIAVQQYTGGTTGVPKGALLTHANVAANTSQSTLWFSSMFKPGNKAIAVLPFFHIFAMTTCLNMPLIAGMTIYTLPRFEMKAFLALLRRSRPNLMPAVPTLISALVNNDTATPAQLSSIELIVSGGAALPNELRAAFARKSASQVVEGYGLTEASPVVCCGPFHGTNKSMSVGLPIPGTDIRFVDIDSGDVVGIGENGELQVKGPQVMAGYHRDEDATAAAFADGWLRTGDVGHMDQEGYVFLVDRIKDLIICSGFNVYPRAIEEALMAHDDVEEVSVIGVPDEYRGEAPVAFVKLHEDRTISEADLKSFLSGTLNKIEMPRQIIFKDALPKTLIGKLSKKELREEYAQMKAGKS